jgi:hypothetical protein
MRPPGNRASPPEVGPKSQDVPGSGGAEPLGSGGAVMDLIWVHPFPLSTPGSTKHDPGPTRIRRRGASSRDRALSPTEVGRSRPAVPKKRLAPSRVSGGVDGRYIGRAGFSCQQRQSSFFRRRFALRRGTRDADGAPRLTAGQALRSPGLEATRPSPCLAPLGAAPRSRR